MDNNFKISKRDIHSDKRTSIIEKHNETINMFIKEEEKLQSYKDELNKLTKIKQAQKQTSRMVNIDIKIKDLSEKIYNIENNVGLTEYLYNAMDFITEESEEYNDDRIIEEKKDGIYKFLKVDSENNKGTQYNNYISKCFNGAKDYHINKNNYTCSLCESIKLQVCEKDGTVECKDCGLVEVRNINSQGEWNVSETHEYFKPYTYKRTNHFKEWINQVQGIVELLYQMLL